MDFDFSKLLSQLPPGVKTELEEMQKKKDELDRADAQVCIGARPAPMETVPGGAKERVKALYGARVHSEGAGSPCHTCRRLRGAGFVRTLSVCWWVFARVTASAGTR